MHTEISPWVEKLSPYRLVIAIGAAGLVLVVALAWVGLALERRRRPHGADEEAGGGRLPAGAVDEPHGAALTCVHRPPFRLAAASSPSASISS
jgi:hypothetical protein